jgi:outer membrane protein TolC
MFRGNPLKFDLRRARAGAAIATLAVALGAVALGSPPSRVDAHARTVAQASPIPGSGTDTPLPAAPSTAPYRDSGLNKGQPTPFPISTLAPLTGQTSLPYPAYGTPVPGVNAGTPAPDVSAVITLPQAILVSFARNPGLEIARQDVNVEAAAVRLERAGLLPQISGAASLTRQHSQDGGFSQQGTTGTTTGGTTTTSGITTGVSGPYTATYADFSGSLSQLIYDGGKIAAGVAAARSAEASSVDNYQREMQTIAFNTATAYYNYLAAERTTQVDLELVREDVVQENLVRAQIAVGTEARAELATVQLPTAQARLAVVRAQGAELQAEAAFANAMGLDANVRVQPVDDAPIYTKSPVSLVPVVSYDVALKRAIALRPDYDAEVQLVKQGQSLVRSASLGLFPTLSGSASASDDSTSQNVGAFRNSNQVGLSLSVPIYDGGTTAANTASARANLKIAQANLQTTGLTVSLNIKQALSGLVSALAAFDQTQQEYATALVNVQSTQAQYRAGVTTLPLLLNAEVQLTQAQTDQVTAVYTLRQAEQTYLYDVGANYDPTGGARSVSVAYPSVVRPETNGQPKRKKKAARA